MCWQCEGDNHGEDDDTMAMFFRPIEKKHGPMKSSYTGCIYDIQINNYTQAVQLLSLAGRVRRLVQV